MLAPGVDILGPWLSAAFGLLVASVGHVFIAKAASTSRQALTTALGAVGVGGNLLMFSSVQMSMLFENSGVRTTLMTAAFQVAYVPEYGAYSIVLVAGSTCFCVKRKLAWR